VIASHILIQAEASPAAIVTAALGEVPGASETASVAGPCDVIARAGTRGTGERGRPGASRAQGLRRRGATAGRRPVARR
jgi:hypothetical protein